MTVTLDISEQVATVTIDRSDRLNALDRESEDRLEEIWRRIEGDSDIRCVVLTGTGDRAFSAGADMKAPGELNGADYWVHARPNGFGGIALRSSLTLPVIARVNGLAMGGGFEMVLGCDIVVAAEHATFALPEARVGRLPLDGGMVLLQRQVPEKLALGMLLTGRRIGAREAQTYGLVNEIVPTDGLDAAVAAWVEDIKACAPLSLKAIKHTVRATGHLGPREAQALRTGPLVTALQSADSEEGVRAFREKRPPKWTGS